MHFARHGFSSARRLWLRARRWRCRQGRDKICGQTAAAHYAALEALKTTRRVWLAPRVSSLCGAAVGSNPAALHSPTARLQWLTRVYNELSTVGGCRVATPRFLRCSAVVGSNRSTAPEYLFQLRSAPARAPPANQLLSHRTALSILTRRLAIPLVC